jgi:D-alanyl-lipoteichoic acid acyltransferase DltB (MBOAT superfamily)
LNGLLLRRILVSVAAALFLWLQTSDPAILTTFAAFVGSGYLAAMLLKRIPNGVLLTAYLIALTAAFIILKKYAFLRLIGGESLLAHALDLIGLSFIFFRQIHYVVDVKQGEITHVALWPYLTYQFNPFTLLAGPIQRYQGFQEDWQKLTPRFTDGIELRLAVLRILIGVIKVSLIGEYCLQVAQTAYYEPEAYGAWPSRLLRFYFFPAFVYFNFTGYCDIVIGGAALFGIRVPENFDRPYLARNMIDYWTRWHRTLSFWIRDYIFTPLYVSIARRRASLASNLAFACYFVALFLAGVWHGATRNFVVFGLLNGAGVSAAKLWENIIVARVGRAGLRRYLASSPILYAARFSTFHFVCLTMFFLQPESMTSLTNLWRMLESLMFGSN